MILAILSDIHGNSLALTHVLNCIKKNFTVDKYINLGDAIGYYPDTDVIYNELSSHNFISLMGNHEAMLLDLLPIPQQYLAIYKLNVIKDNITNNSLSFISSLKPFYEFEMDGLKLLFVHGSPSDPLNGRIYPDTVIDGLLYKDIDFVFMGHTHRPLFKIVNRTRFVNVGSVGLPRDDGRMASFCIFDTKKKRANIFRVELDINRLQQFYGTFIHNDVKSLYKRQIHHDLVGQIL